MTENGAPGPRPDGPYAWLVVAAGFAVLLIIWGVVFSFSVYANALASRVGVSRVAVSTVFSAELLTFYLVGGLSGLALARIRVRRIVAIGAVAAALAVAAVAAATTHWQLLAAFGVLGAVFGAVFTTILSVVPLWFDRHRGLATGVLLVGNGLGLQVVPPALAWSIGRLGVRSTFLAIAGITVVVFGVAAGVIRRPSHGVADASVAVDAEWLRSLARDRRFRLAIVGFPLVWVWFFSLTAIAVDLIVTTGPSRAVASGIFGLVGGISIPARVAAGAIGDRLGQRRTFTASLILVAAGFLALAAVPTRDMVSVVFVGFGVGMGGAAALYAPVVLARFDPRRATGALGLFHASEAAAGMLTPAVITAAVVAFGGYRIPLLAVAGLTLVGAATLYVGTAPDPA